MNLSKFQLKIIIFTLALFLIIGKAFAASPTVLKVMDFMGSTKKTFVYTNGSSTTTVVFKNNQDQGKLWNYINVDKTGKVTQTEYIHYVNGKELMCGIPYSDFTVSLLKEPIKKGNMWKEYGLDNEEIGTHKIISVNETVKISAGTFKNTILVRTTSPGGAVYDSYYSKGIGHVLTTHKGKKVNELLKIMNR